MTRWAAFACCGLLLQCSSKTEDTPDCSNYVAQAESSEVAQTPRANERAEILALEASSSLVAPQALYERVAAEIDAIFSAEPVLRMCKPLSEVPIDDVRVDFTEAGWKKVAAGHFHAWDCANATYGGTPALNSQWHTANVTFGDKVYRGALLEAEYDALPEASASRDTYFYDDRDACLESKARSTSTSSTTRAETAPRAALITCTRATRPRPAQPPSASAASTRSRIPSRRGSRRSAIAAPDCRGSPGLGGVPRFIFLRVR